MSTAPSPLISRLRGGLIASCQPVRGGPLDEPCTVAALAQATLAGGAAGLRLEGLADLRAVRGRVAVPVIGLVKRETPGTAVYITPHTEDVHALRAAGVDVVAFDATARARPVPVAAMIRAIHATGAEAMADVSTLEEGLAAWEAGAALVGTTLSGYTAESCAGRPPPTEPDLALVAALARLGVRTVAEGRLGTPAQARAALDAGAYAVTVGSALTRIELVTRGFVAALGTAERHSTEVSLPGRRVTGPGGAGESP